MPVNTTAFFPNLLHNGDTNRIAAAIGTAPTMPKIDIANAGSNPANFMLFVNDIMDPFLIPPDNWNNR